MISFDKIIEEIESLESYRSLKALKEKIESDKKYLIAYQDILDIQKEVVKLEYYQYNQSAKDKRQQYLSKLEEFKNEVIVHEYLTYLDEFSDFIHEVEELINQTI